MLQKVDVSKILEKWRAHYFFEMKERCKVPYVKIIAWLIVFKEGTNTLVFTFSNMVLNIVPNVVLNLVLNSISLWKEMQ